MKINETELGVHLQPESPRDKELMGRFIKIIKSSKKAIASEKILEAALALAIVIPYSKLTREIIATQADVSPALVSHYYVDMDVFKQVILKEAIHRKIPEIIAHGLTLKEPEALAIDPVLRDQALEVLKCQ